MPLQIRRGTTAERLSITPLIGEPVFDTTLGQIFVGDGTTAGGTSPNIDAETIEQALDTVGAALVNGVHQNISFVYGTVQDNSNRIDANVSVSTLLENLDLNGFDIVGNGNINITGSITGNIKGSIFADDSTLLVDGTNGTIPWAVISDAPAFLTEVPGAISADVTGSIFADDSTMLVDAVNGQIVGPLNTNSVITSNLSVNTISTTFSTNNQIIFNQQDLTTNSIEINKYSNNNTFAAGISFLRSRGNESAQTSVAFGDRIGSLSFKANDGTSVTDTVSISAEVTGSVSTGVVPTSLIFSSLGIGETARIDAEGIFRMNRNGSQDIFAAFQSAHSSSSDNASFRFVRSRNNVLSPSSVVEGDSIIDILFAGRAGVFAVTSSLIKAVIDGPVSASVAPGRLEFHTANLSGTVSSRMVLKNDGKLQVNHIESLNDGLTIVGDITGSVFSDNSTRIIDGTEGGKITTPSITLSDFLQLPVYIDDAERSASIPSPTIGMVIFIGTGTTPAASNQPQYFNGSSWTNI